MFDVAACPNLNDRTSMTDVITTHTHTHTHRDTHTEEQTDRQTDVERTGINRHRLVEGVHKFAPPRTPAPENYNRRHRPRFTVRALWLGLGW